MIRTFRLLIRQLSSIDRSPLLTVPIASVLEPVELHGVEMEGAPIALELTV